MRKTVVTADKAFTSKVSFKLISLSFCFVKERNLVLRAKCVSTILRKIFQQFPRHGSLTTFSRV